MKLLVIGNGGREHALAWKLAQSPLVERIYVAKGNAGTHREPKVENIDIDPLNFEGLVDFAKREAIDFTVVGPEVPLVAGIVNYFEERDLPCLGPNQYAAQLEGSKAFSKAFMQKYHIPTAKADTFSDSKQALDFLNTTPYPVVIKADGLAAGKGVIIAQDKEEAKAAVHTLISQRLFGSPEQKILIEEFLEGEEVSFIVLSDGVNFIPFATSQDHKRRDDADKGPNTGGMGAYSPAPIITPDLHQKILASIIVPTLAGMRQEGSLFKGFLYAGLMITPNFEIKVLEFNCRFGDPETQPVLMRLQSDFAQMCQAALQGNLHLFSAQWTKEPALGVVLASRGYPDNVTTGVPLPHLNEIPPSPQYKIFHAGTKMEDSQIVSNGGRVLCVTALGEDIAHAQQQAYRLLKKIAWEGGFYRHDIGYKALKELS